MIGSVAVPRSGTYTPTADLGTYFSFNSGVVLQIKKKALNLDMQLMIIMAACIILGAALAYLTSPPELRRPRGSRN